ncbi:MAG: alpha-galactosidase [Clostridiales bacterium]|jgi:alpha-galactosidase|nr:alpha-galactosidase [Clostridiales bacterium]
MQIIKHKLGALTALYAERDGSVTFTLAPTATLKNIDEKKLTLDGVKFGRPDPMVQVHVFGDAANRQYSAGRTMRNSDSCFQLKYDGQTVQRRGGATEIATRFRRADGQTAEHRLRHKPGRRFVECFTAYTNGSDRDVTLEMLSSFSIGCLTPYAPDNPTGKITLHRMRSQWSAEAQLESFPAETLQLEPSWLNYGARGERFGVAGSTPCRGFMPLIGLTDERARVTWAADWDAPSSWQAEFYLSQNAANLSGGLADFEFGHWRKTLRPGETFAAPPARLTAARGGMDEAAQILTEFQREKPLPPREEGLPILYNEYCKTWGQCSRENLLPLIDASAKLGIDTFVIDAGWYDKADKSSGFYAPKRDYYPDGIGEVVRRINAAGMQAGIWFEYESRDYDELTRGGYGDCLLTRGGVPIRNMERAFLDMRRPEAAAELDKSVIGFLRDNGFGYVKVDYNENIGVGCDGAESLGEGLRQHALAARGFLERIKRALPDTVLEVCASGGLRTEPSFIAAADQVSYSDIHEADEGAIVAGDLHRVLQPAKSQIWAVIRAGDDENRLVNTVSKCFLGRMCFSGDVDQMNAAQEAVVRRAIALYRECAPVIRDGRSYFLGKRGKSLRNPSGYSAVLRAGRGGAVLVVNTFDGKRGVLSFRHKALKGLKIRSVFATSGAEAEVEGDGAVVIRGLGARSGGVVLLN